MGSGMFSLSVSPRAVVVAPLPPRRPDAAFTLLELVTVIFIVAILAVMALPVFKNLQQRARLASCTANLRSLYVGANGFIQDHNRWPQIPAPDVRQGRDDAYVRSWQQALQPYGITQTTWVCPELHRLRGGPDLTLPQNRCVDYLANTFGPQPRRPYEHSSDPWFIEATNAHGLGQLIIFSNGAVMGMQEAAATFINKPDGK